MANLIEHLTSISPKSRSGSSPGRRIAALALCAMLAFSSTLPAVAFAGESDSEGTGTAPPIEAPGVPDFDPGGEEAGLEDAPASGGAEEGGAVEVEPEVDVEAPAPEEVTSAVTDVIEDPQPQPVEPPTVATPAPEPEPVQQAAVEPAQTEPVANQSIVAPRQKPAQRHTAHGQTAPTEAMPPTAPAEEEVPSSPPPQPVAATPVDPGRSLADKDSYVVRPGDCLWHIAADLLPGEASTQEIEREVERLWRLNEDRIGTGDPSLIYSGTVLRLR
jgi:hypothetical protein